MPDPESDPEPAPDAEPGPDPVSWLLVEAGWPVLDRDGNEVGTVAQVLGDSVMDIFAGLSVATGILGRRLYVPSERVAAIVEGEVRLDLTGEEFGGLDEYTR
jgi:hypothetical protein